MRDVEDAVPYRWREMKSETDLVAPASPVVGDGVLDVPKKGKRVTMKRRKPPHKGVPRREFASVGGSRRAVFNLNCILLCGNFRQSEKH